MTAGLRARIVPDLIQFGNLPGEHMKPAHVTYMPILKTKKGEWEALRHLAESDRDLMFPLIECTTLVFCAAAACYRPSEETHRCAGRLIGDRGSETANFRH